MVHVIKLDSVPVQPHKGLSASDRGFRLTSSTPTGNIKPFYFPLWKVLDSCVRTELGRAGKVR
jgi:hypothetical protein